MLAARGSTDNDTASAMAVPSENEQRLSSESMTSRSDNHSFDNEQTHEMGQNQSCSMNSHLNSTSMAVALQTPMKNRCDRIKLSGNRPVLLQS